MVIEMKQYDMYQQQEMIVKFELLSHHKFYYTINESILKYIQ